MEHMASLLEKYHMRREDDEMEKDDDEFDFDLDSGDDDLDVDMDMGDDDDVDPDFDDDGEVDDHEEHHGDTESRLDDLEDKVTDILNKLSQVVAQDAIDDMGGDDDMGDDEGDDEGDDDLDLGDEEGEDDGLLKDEGYDSPTIDSDLVAIDDDDIDDEAPVKINPEIRRRIEDRLEKLRMARELGLEEYEDKLHKAGDPDDSDFEADGEFDVHTHGKRGDKKALRFKQRWGKHRVEEDATYDENMKVVYKTLKPIHDNDDPHQPYQTIRALVELARKSRQIPSNAMAEAATDVIGKPIEAPDMDTELEPLNIKEDIDDDTIEMIEDMHIELSHLARVTSARYFYSDISNDPNGAKRVQRMHQIVAELRKLSGTDD